MPRITLSYRRGDAPADAGRIFDRLSGHYGKESVFMDIDTIPFGVDFRTYVETALESTHIVLAIIGPKWLGRRGGHTRIQDATDPVRLEIEAAMRLGKIIVPVLVANATMPPPAALPATIVNLSYLNAAEVDPGKDFHMNLDRLIRFIDELHPSAVARSPAVEQRSEPEPEPEPAQPAPAPPPAATGFRPTVPKAKAVAPAVPADYARRVTAAWPISLIRGVVTVLYFGPLAFLAPSTLSRGGSLWFLLYSIVVLWALWTMANRLAGQRVVRRYFLAETALNVGFVLLVLSRPRDPSAVWALAVVLVLILVATTELAAGMILVRYVRAERWRVVTGVLLLVTLIPAGMLFVLGLAYFLYMAYALAGIMLIVLALRLWRAHSADEAVATT